MTPEDFIEKAIDRGVREGLFSLDPVEQAIFAVSEAEVYCDMEGIDSLLDRYGGKSTELFASAFSAVGAVEIAETLRAMAAAGVAERDKLLTRANELITARSQYSYESIRAFVERQI
jgi:hypothetical protein